ncbi:alpha/beta hydrolase [Pseudonocardia sp. H11422]|uniref:alpha/beta hydrolase n=1 Tax=Pseudonocardia sp. H11422 TaxID=2835866 RepID=UPI001BDC3E76|nr:alpha/beta hydrolase [Pseudonocardia sp. H11422]
MVGTAWAALAMTPSLVPRDWMFQGVVSGISAAAGYGTGVVLAWLAVRSARWRRVSDLVRHRAPPWADAAAWAVLLVAAPVLLVTMLVVAASWQREVAALTAMDQSTTSGWLRAGPLLLVVAAALLVAARGIRWSARLLARALGRWARLPGRWARALGAVLAGLLVVTVVDDVVLSRALAAADSAFSGLNSGTYPGVEQPLRPTRSGSPGSLVPWDTLGREGRSFVAGGPSPQELADIAGRPPLDPIRAYVGLESAPTAQERVDLAVAELERAGAFDRAVLAVVTTTGTGWVNVPASDGLELMYGGDTAIVATQYSYLPSWLSFLVDRSRSEEAGRLLFDAVHARVDPLPEGNRPRLLVYGESLGSQGSEAAFTTLADIRAQADGVLWVGPPNSNRLWNSLVERRDPGTPEVDPVYASGLVVRFASGPADLAEPPTPWAAPRVLYLQHPSDPVVWWSPDLLFRRPDWLVEPRGDDVSPAMSWYPVVTFWQVTADLTNAQSVPDGHGHNYGDMIADGWAAVAAPEGWTEDDTARVRQALAS